MEYNLKEREVYCAKCNKYILTDEPAPRCPICGNGMITVLSKEPLHFPSFQLLDNKKK